MTAPLCRCGCGRELIKHDYETLGQWERRQRSGLFRAKCKRNLPTAPKGERPKPTLSLISASYGREGGEAQAKEVPVVDETYRRMVRGLTCLIPGCENPSIFHHQHKKGHGTKGGLCTDYRGMNVCEWHHTMGGTVAAPGSYHGMGKLTGWKFWQHYGVDVETVIHDLNRAWLESGHKFKED